MAPELFEPQVAGLETKALELISKLIETPSISGNEDGTAAILYDFFTSENIPVQRMGNNILVRTGSVKDARVRLLLNSHHDTVKPNPGYTRDPFEATVEGNKLYGLGSNDAGASLVCLVATFLHFYHQPALPMELVLAATAEEEISGKNGIVSILDALDEIDLAIVGEPTQMQVAIVEKGLMVLDCETEGSASHVAHSSADNAIYQAIPDLEWFKNYRFPKKSEYLGEVTMQVTAIHAGGQHNVVPDRCQFTVDVRSTEQYSNEEILKIILQNVGCTVIPRSTRLNSSGITLTHPIIKAAAKCGITHYGSPTLSDQALMPFPSIKIGPGDSLRSHTSNEFIYLHEIKNGIEKYIELLTRYMQL